jgi:hypothetical protein
MQFSRHDSDIGICCVANLMRKRYIDNAEAVRQITNWRG